MNLNDDDDDDGGESELDLALRALNNERDAGSEADDVEEVEEVEEVR